MKGKNLVRRKQMTTYDAVETAIEQAKRNPRESWIELLRRKERPDSSSVKPIAPAENRPPGHREE